MVKMKQIYQRLSVVLIILGIAILPAALPPQVAAQEDSIQVIDQSWDANFRDHLTFTLGAESTAEIVEVDLFYRVVGQLATSRNEADFTPGTAIEAEFVIDQTEPANYLPPGTELQYWWKIIDAGGNELKTDQESLLFLDNRYPWQTLENEQLTLYWYEGDDSFGQRLFDRANLALDTLETDIGIALENPIKIFIYANHSDLLGAISSSAQEWTGGQAFTTYGVVVIGVHPSQLDWGLNATTHEMSHLVIHQATDNPFGSLPRWLDEGIAVYNENRDELDDDFRPLFERAVRDNKLMTLRTLSSPFPADPLEANLAYGQSGAVVRFIVDTYGSEAMAELLAIFAEGALYDEALEQALGVDTDSLDNAFRASLDLPPLPGTETNISTEAETLVEEATTEETDAPEVTEETDAPEPEKAEVTEELEPASDNAEAASAPAEAETASPSASETTESTERSVSVLPCLAGIVALLVMGIVVHGLHSR